MRVCRSLWTSAFVLAVLASSASVDAQSLGDMAQRSAERAQQKAARTYTNDDLPAPAPTTVAATSVAVEPVAAPAPAPPADTAAADTATPPASDSTRRPRIIENPAAGTANVVWEAPANKPDEAQWRSLIGGLRARISKTVADITAAEAHLTRLQDGPQTAASARDRLLLEKTLAKRRHDARMLGEELSMHLGRAAGDGVPREWTD